MAKKKEFGNIVEDSFNEGYKSEPEVVSRAPEESKLVDNPPPASSSRIPTENEILLRKLLTGDESIINDMLKHMQRTTYYMSELHRECVDIVAYEEGMPKQEVVKAALEKYFDEKTVAAAKEKFIQKKAKELRVLIEKENNQ